MIGPLLLLVWQVTVALPGGGGAVHLGVDTVFVPRVSMGAFTPADRAAAANDRLARAWRDRSPGDSVTLAPAADGTLILVAGQPMLTVLPGDSVPAAQVGARLSAAWRAADGPDSWRALLLGVARSALALALTIVAWRLLLLLGRRLRRALLPVITGWVRDLRVGEFTLVRGGAIRRTAQWLVGLPLWGAGALLLYAATTYILIQFPATTELGRGLGRTLLAAVGDLFLRGLAVVPDLLLAALILLLVRVAVRLSDAFFEAVEEGTLELPSIHPDVARPTRKLVAVLLWLFAIVLVYPLLPGSESNVFKGVSIFLGVLVSLGSSGIVGNAMSGLVLMYSRAFKRGEYIEVDGVTGEVLELGMLATKVRTPKRVEVTIPNAVVVTHGVRNHSRLAEGEGVVLHTTVTLGYDTPWRTVHATLIAAARAVEGVRHEPAPFVLQTALNDFHVSYELNASIDDPVRTPALLAALHASIQDHCNRAGIEILSPAFEVRRAGPADTRLPPERWGRASD